MFLKFDHFSHSIWSSNSGHEHEKGGHMNPMVLIALVAYKNIHFFGQEAQIRQYISNLTTFRIPCGHQIEVMSRRKVVT